MSKIFISAGEVSGDMYGAKLIQTLLTKDPSLKFIGMGHRQMKAAGAHILADVAQLSTVGFIEPLKYLPKLLHTYIKMKTALKKERPDLVVVIDFQGYHMMFIKAAKKLGIPVVYYISPQEWQWGSDEGGKKVIQYTDKILSIFPQEHAFYQRLGGNSVFIGHPIMDVIKQIKQTSEFHTQHGLPKDKKTISFFPGSRQQELTHLMPVFINVAKKIIDTFPDSSVVFSVASPMYLAQLQRYISDARLTHKVHLYSGNSHELIKHTYLSIVSSGTVTLEHACIGTPCIVAYKVSHLSYMIAKKLIGKKVEKIGYISLPNIISGKAICAEFIQDSCTESKIFLAVQNLLTKEDQYLQIKEEFNKIRTNIESDNATQRAADEVLQLLR